MNLRPFSSELRRLLAAVAGLLAGLLAGSLGVGGGSVTIPFLIFILNLPVEEAVATNLFIVFITSVFSMYFHKRQGTLREKGVIMGVVGIIGTLLGNAIFFQIKGRMLERILGAVFLTLAILVLINKEGFRTPSVRELIIAGLFMGIYSGVTGKGGGSLAVPFLVLVFKVQTKEAIGVTAAATPIVALSSMIPKALAGLVNFKTALQFLPGLIVGTLVGARIMKRSEPKTLRAFFSLFLFVVGLKMLLG